MSDSKSGGGGFGMFSRMIQSVAGSVIAAGSMALSGEHVTIMRQEIEALEALCKQLFMELDDLHVERVSFQ